MKQIRTSAAALLLVAGSAAADCPGAALHRQIGELARAQGTQIAETVGRIDGEGRQLLALRSYLRASNSIAARWSWTQKQIETYRQSAEYEALLAEIERIRARFEADNPGYQLYANTDVRSLDLQIERWNGNGYPSQAKGETIPPAMRVVHLSHDMEAIGRIFSHARAVDAAAERRDRTYDPVLADLFVTHGRRWLDLLTTVDPWGGTRPCAHGRRRLYRPQVALHGRAQPSMCAAKHRRCPVARFSRGGRFGAAPGRAGS